jgi:hypothetical protein
MPIGEMMDLDAIVYPNPDYVQPVPNTRLCGKCGTLIRNIAVPDGEGVWDGIAEYHIRCEPDEDGMKFAYLPGPSGLDLPERRELLDVIEGECADDVRSQQLAVGPSEIGGACVRRLAMRIDAVPSVNRTNDPWPSEVGTAIHAQLQKRFEARNRRLGRRRWVTETRVFPDPIISGSSDLYDSDRRVVIDFKTMGKSAEHKLMKDGPDEGYYKQIQVYGLGFARAGYRVDKVGLFFLPRSGFLRDAPYYEWDFNPAVAQEVIARVYSVGKALADLKARNPGVDIWGQVPSSDGNFCAWCPFYDRRADVVSATGCPGHHS